LPGVTAPHSRRRPTALGLVSVSFVLGGLAGGAIGWQIASLELPSYRAAPTAALPAAAPAAARPLRPIAEADPVPAALPPQALVPSEPTLAAALLVEPAAPPPASPQLTAQTVTVQRGDTLSGILIRAGVAAEDTRALVAGLSEHYDPRRLRPGQELSLAFAAGEPELEAAVPASLSLSVDATTELVLERDATGGYAARTIARALAIEPALASGTIQGSLYHSARQAGLPTESLAELVKLLSWDVDFQRDIHPGDRFEVVHDLAVDGAGGLVRGQGVQFATLTLRDRTITAYRFEREDGGVEFFDAAGRPLRKWLLRTPIDGARLSSGFGPRRHPILGYSRMHRGVDFAAPTGTPIFAAGDGTVEFVGRNRGYGNYVKIRHNSEYATAYAHLSSFAKGLARGRRVRQGEVIGRVGSTGMSTGPHLHYEVIHKGEQIDPLALASLDQPPLAGAELGRFAAERARIDALRATLRREIRLAERAYLTD
jgi:murein DD-endopeptidase MepM/ murein hydrolase activator NlpD